MLQKIRLTLEIIGNRSKEKLQLIILFRFFSSVTDFIGVGAVIPLIMMMANPDIIEENKILNTIYSFIGVSEKNDFIVLFSFIVILILFASAVIGWLGKFITFKYIYALNAKISTKLMKNYLVCDDDNFNKTHSAQLISNINIHAARFCNGVVLSLIELIGHASLCLVIVTVLLITEFKITAVTFIVIAASYYFLFVKIKKIVVDGGKNIAELSTDRNKQMIETFSFKDVVRLYHMEPKLIDHFQRRQIAITKLQTKIAILGSSPIYVMEFLAVFIIIAISIYLFTKSSDFDSHVGTLTLFGVSTYRLLPACQRTYNALGNLMASSASVPKVYEDLILEESLAKQANVQWEWGQRIQLSNIDFKYSDGHELFKSLSLNIPLSGVIQLKGRSGSGKSTLVKMLAGICRPASGELVIAGNNLSDVDVRAWQDHIAYVPQQTYIMDATLVENITLNSEFDQGRLDDAIRACEIADLKDNLPKGWDSRLGENASLLSGGQKQRIGIARALCKKAEILIMDESMSSIDISSAKRVFQSILDLHYYQAIIVITHREAELPYCDHIIDVDTL